MSVVLKSKFLANARGFTLKDANGITWSINNNTNEISAAYSGSGSAGAANPAAKVGLTTVDGSAATFMRSDAAPPIDQTITPTWTAKHTFSTPPVISGITWTAPTLLNSWANYGSGYSPAGYYKDPAGRVFIRGMLASGSSASAVMFTLPVGFRPAFEMIFATVALDAFCEIRIDTSGNVFANTGGSTNFTALDGISFATF